MYSVCQERGGVYFLDAPGGTGKTFLSKIIIAKCMARKLNIVSTASSGIAATLLPKI